MTLEALKQQAIALGAKFQSLPTPDLLRDKALKLYSARFWSMAQH